MEATPPTKTDLDDAYQIFCEQIKHTPCTRQLFEQGCQFLVCKQDGEVIGFASFMFNGFEVEKLPWAIPDSGLCAFYLPPLTPGEWTSQRPLLCGHRAFLPKAFCSAAVLGSLDPHLILSLERHFLLWFPPHPRSQLYLLILF